MISAVILAKNEEKNIKECLDGLKWCDEILVIDDNSTDKTREIAKKEGARVFERPLNGDFASQRNFGLEKARYDWVLFVDADERISPELQAEIQKEIKENDISGFYFKRIDYFLGRWLKYGEIGQIRLLRLAKKEAGKWQRRVDEKWLVRGKTKTFKNPLLHYSHPNLAQFLRVINERSMLNAQVFYQEGKKINFWEWFKPLGKFLKNYFLLLGFLDGIQGFIFAVLMSFHSFAVRVKLYLLWKNKKT